MTVTHAGATGEGNLPPGRVEEGWEVFTEALVVRLTSEG